jgi:hypothetical protein
MIPAKRSKSDLGVGIGIFMQIVALVLMHQKENLALIGCLLIVASLVPFLWGCMNYAEAKGHSKWVGLVGVAGIIGLIVLVILPEQKKSDAAHGHPPEPHQ